MFSNSPLSLTIRWSLKPLVRVPLRLSATQGRTKKPIDGSFPSLCQILKDPMTRNTPIVLKDTAPHMTNFDAGRINKTNACTFAKTMLKVNA